MYFIIISKTSVRWMSVYKETIDETTRNKFEMYINEIKLKYTQVDEDEIKE